MLTLHTQITTPQDTNGSADYDAQLAQQRDNYITGTRVLVSSAATEMLNTQILLTQIGNFLMLKNIILSYMFYRFLTCKTAIILLLSLIHI